MRFSLALLGFIFCCASFAQETKSPAYPVSNFPYVTLATLQKIIDSGARTLVIFSDGSCLWNSIPARGCFAFERFFDAKAHLARRGDVTVVGFDVSFIYLNMMERFDLRLRPTAVLFERGGEVARSEPRFLDPVNGLVVNWHQDMLDRIRLQLAR